MLRRCRCKLSRCPRWTLRWHSILSDRTPGKTLPRKAWYVRRRQCSETARAFWGDLNDKNQVNDCGSLSCGKVKPLHIRRRVFLMLLKKSSSVHNFTLSSTHGNSCWHWSRDTMSNESARIRIGINGEQYCARAAEKSDENWITQKGQRHIFNVLAGTGGGAGLFPQEPHLSRPFSHKAQRVKTVSTYAIPLTNLIVVTKRLVLCAGYWGENIRFKSRFIMDMWCSSPGINNLFEHRIEVEEGIRSVRIHRPQRLRAR